MAPVLTGKRLHGWVAAVRGPHRRFFEVAGALAVYTLCTLYLTWPLVTDLGSTVYLYPKNPAGPGDLAGAIAELREFIDGGHNPFAPGLIGDFNAPDGLENRWALNLASLPSTLLLYALGLAFGATAAYGLFAMLGYIASGLAMFLLARKLTDSAWIGLIIGWAFAFYPFAVVKGEHVHFLHGWVFVVLAWRMLELMERPTARNGLWAGLAAVLALSWTPYFILLGGVCYATFTIAALLLSVRRNLRRNLIAHVPAVALVLGVGLATRSLVAHSGEDASIAGNRLGDIISTAAHVPMYLVPPANNLLLGDRTVSYLNDHGWNAVEWSLYVGLTVLVLALAGLVAAVTRRLQPSAARFAIACFLVVVAGVVFSLPPQMEIGGHLVRLPSYLVFQVSTGWRLYTRFVIVVMLGLCVLAAFGLAYLTRGHRPRWRVALLALVTVLVPPDLWNRPPDTTYRIETPRIYSIARAQPEGIVAEYPLRPVLDARDYLDLYFQEAHGKPVLNGYRSGPDEQRALALTRLDDPSTAGHLATLGVRYVILTPHRIAAGVPPPGIPGPGLRPVNEDGYATLYRVIARPVPFVFGRVGLEPPQGRPGHQYQWVSAASAELEIDAPCELCEGLLRFTAASFGRRRLLAIETKDGTTLKLVSVPGERKEISVHLRVRRRAVVRLTTNPGPDSIQETTGAPDPRKVSIAIRNLRFESARSP